MLGKSKHVSSSGHRSSRHGKGIWTDTGRRRYHFWNGVCVGMHVHSRISFTRPMRTRWALICLGMLLSAMATGTPIAVAQQRSEWYDYSWSATMSKAGVQPGEVFSARIVTQATSRVTMPIRIENVVISARVVAKRETDGSMVNLNDAFTMSMDALPNAAGQGFEVDSDVPLAFPIGAKPGKYGTAIEITGVRFQIMGMSGDGSPYMPAGPFAVGTVECLADGPGLGRQTSEASSNPGQSPAAEWTVALPDSGDQEEKDGVIDGSSTSESSALGRYGLLAAILVGVSVAAVLIVLTHKRRQAI